MNVNHGIIGRLGRYVSSHLRTRTPPSAETTGTVAATSAVASTALASTPAISSTTGKYYFGAVPAAQNIMTHLVRFLGINELIILSSFNEVAAKMGKEEIVNEWAKLGVAIKPEDIPPVPNDARLMPNEYFVLIPKGISMNNLGSELTGIKGEIKEDWGKKATESFYWVVGSTVAVLPHQNRAKVIESNAVTLIYEERTGERLLRTNPLMEKTTLLSHRLI